MADGTSGQVFPRPPPRLSVVDDLLHDDPSPNTRRRRVVGLSPRSTVVAAREAMVRTESLPSTPVINYSQLSAASAAAADSDLSVSNSQTETEPDPPVAAAAAASAEDVGDEPVLGSFNFQAVKAHFTYRGWCEFGRMRTFLDSFGEIRALSMVHEEGHSTGVRYRHTHVAVCWKKKVRSKNARVFDFEGIHPHVKMIKNEQQWQNCVKYHTKEVPSPEHLVQEGVDAVSDNQLMPAMLFMQQAKSWQQVLLNAEIAPLISTRMAWAKAYFQACRPAPPSQWKLEEAHNWQLDLIRIIDLVKMLSEEDWKVQITFNGLTRSRQKWWNRSIFWLYDTVGDTGKSFLAKELAISRKWLAFDAIKKADLAYLASREDYEGFIADLPRSFDPSSSLFTEFMQMLEKIRDGMITNPKYESSLTLTVNKPVFVLANFCIDNTDAKYVSEDRLLVFEIGIDPNADSCLKDFLNVFFN